MAENKVQFNLKNVHYAVLTEGATNSWATPVAVNGAVSLSLDANGADTTFYADGVAYYKSFANNGYEGTLEMAKITDAMLEDIWGIEADPTDKVQYEYTGVEPAPFALLFEIDGDADEELYVLYRCVAGRPPIASSTNEDGKTPVTQSISVSALPMVTGDEVGLIKGRTTADTPTATKTAWFTSVVTP